MKPHNEANEPETSARDWLHGVLLRLKIGADAYLHSRDGVLYTLGMGPGGRELIVAEYPDVDGVRVFVPITDSEEADMLEQCLTAYAGGAKFVLVREALTNLELGNMLDEIERVLEKHDREPIASSSSLARVRKILRDGRQAALERHNNPGT